MLKTAMELLAELNDLDETPNIEAKTASEIGHSLAETMCAFANEPHLGGGYIVLGVRRLGEETLFSSGYEVVGIDNPDKAQADIASQAATMFNKPLRPQMRPESVSGKTVIVIFIPESQASEKPFFLKKFGLPRGAFRLIGSTDQSCTEEDVAVLFQSRSSKTYDMSVPDDAEMDDIDIKALMEYRRLRSIANPSAIELSDTDENLLYSLHCIARVKGELKPTVAGIILFGTASAFRRLFPMQRVDYIRIQGSKWVENPDVRFMGTVDFRGSIFSILPRVQATIMDDLMKSYHLPENSLHSITEPKLPLRVIREALVNALMHRAYNVHKPIQIIRYSNRLEIRNPGYSLKSPEFLGEPGSEARNPYIAAVLHDVNIAETKGSGIRIMRQNMAQAELTPPIFDSNRDKNEFVSTLLFHHFLSEDDLQWLRSFQDCELTSEEIKALTLVREIGNINNQTYRDINATHPLDATQHLTRLRELELLEQRGGKRGQGVHYIAGKRLIQSLHENPLTNLDEKSTNLNEKSTNLDEKSTNLDEKSTNLNEKSTNLDEKSTNLDEMYSETPTYIREKLLLLSKRSSKESLRQIIFSLCAWRPLSTKQLALYTNRTDHHILHNYLQPMIREGLLEYTIPDKPNHAEQAYRTVQSISSSE